MATDVTILEAWINSEQYSQGGGVSSFSQQIITGGGGTSNMTWIGAVANGVGTYGGLNSIVAELYLKCNGDHTLVGNLTNVKGGGGDHILAVGSEGVSEEGQIQIIGSTTSNVKIGGLSFHNDAAASATNDRVAEIQANRYADDDAAELIFGVGAGDGTFYDRYHMTLAEFMPDVTNSLNLGHPSYYWASGYITNLFSTAIRASGLAGTGIRNVTVDADGDLTVGGEVAVAVSYTDCPDNATTDIVVGDSATDITFLIHYIASRNMGTVQLQSGFFTLLYDSTTDTVYVPPYQYVGEDLDFDITANVTSSGDIQLNIVVGNANVNNLSFDYNVYSKFTT